MGHAVRHAALPCTVLPEHGNACILSPGKRQALLRIIPDKKIISRFSPAMNTLFSRLIVLLSLVLVAACARSSVMERNPAPTGRPGPAYVQWLEEQACLRKASDLTAVVSGSGLIWKHSSRSSLLPENARTWFRVSPALTAWTGHDPLTSALAESDIAERLSRLGIQGIILSGLADTGDEWAGRSPAFGHGEDGTSLHFGRLSGTEKDYAGWLTGLSRAGLLPGGTLLPANTGMGPDFFLSIRAVRDYPGLYAMTELSPSIWPMLPPLKKHDTAALSSADTAALAAQGELPPSLVQDSPIFSSVPRGWAVTGPITGVDGVKRRWAYRWYLRHDRPVLHWDDPSGAARRVMEADLIQHVGLRHEILVGISAGAWMGLDAASRQTPGENTPEPGLSALRDLTRNAHRYGSAVFVQDTFSPEQLADLMPDGPDFFHDCFLSPALERSLLKGTAEEVRSSLRSAIRQNINQQRLWRAAPDGLPRSELAALRSLLPDGWTTLLTLKNDRNGALRLNAPTLAAVLCHVAPGARPDAATGMAIQNAHQLMLATRAFLPGLLILSGADLDGSLPEGKDWPGTPPLWQLDGMSVSRRGLPSGFALYRHMPGEHMDDVLQRMLTARAAVGIASGTLISVPSCDDDGILITVCSLPKGGYMAFFGNLSRKETSFSPRFPQWTTAEGRQDLISGQAHPATGMTLPPWGWKAVLLR